MTSIGCMEAPGENWDDKDMSWIYKEDLGTVALVS